MLQRMEEGPDISKRLAAEIGASKTIDKGATCIPQKIISNPTVVFNRLLKYYENNRSQDPRLLIFYGNLQVK